MTFPSVWEEQCLLKSHSQASTICSGVRRGLGSRHSQHRGLLSTPLWWSVPCRGACSHHWVTGLDPDRHGDCFSNTDHPLVCLLGQNLQVDPGEMGKSYQLVSCQISGSLCVRSISCLPHGALASLTSHPSASFPRDASPGDFRPLLQLFSAVGDPCTFPLSQVVTGHLSVWLSDGPWPPTLCYPASPVPAYSRDSTKTCLLEKVDAVAVGYQGRGRKDEER